MTLHATARLIVHGPTAPLGGSPALVGDKSLSHRALILGALADGDTRLANLSPCADVGRTVDCLLRLGVMIEPWDVREPGDGSRAVVHGRGVQGLGGPPVLLDCGDSGTTMRLLAGVLAGQPREAFTLDGAPGLRRRPMERVAAPLVAMGAEMRTDAGHPPLTGRGRRLVGAEIALAQASAQLGSAVLLAGLGATGTTRLRYPAPVRDHTERMLAAMGAPIQWDGLTTTLRGPVAALAALSGDSGALALPDDPSAAAFLLAAAAIVPGSEVHLRRVGVNPGRTGFVDILGAMGARIDFDGWAVVAGEPVADIHLVAAPLRGTDVAGTLIARSIDELPLVAVLATQAQGRTVIAGASELRVKESDRIAAMAEGLARMGARVEAGPDGLIVDGPTPLRGAAVEGWADHRIVMALAVAGLAARGETSVTHAERVGDSFPGFVAALGALGGVLIMQTV